MGCDGDEKDLRKCAETATEATGLSRSTVDQHVGWLAAGCSRLDTTSKNAMPGNIRVIVVGSGIGEFVRTPEMAYKAKLLPSPNWS